MRKALCVGIDCYEHVDDLHGCVNDANSVKAALERNGDGTLNFEVKLMCATSEASYINRNDLRDAIENLFSLDYPSIIMGVFIIILGVDKVIFIQVMAHSMH